MFASELHRRHSEADGISACSVMPGGIHTGLQGDVDTWTMLKWKIVTPFFFKSIEQGAATTLQCALKEDLSGANGGAYYNNCAKTDVASKNSTPEGCQKLWELTEALIDSEE
jgi:WW domain-containing oxidoreductase